MEGSVKGIIFNLLEEFITAELGPERLEEIEGSTALQTTDPFVGPGSYPDADLVALVGAAGVRLGTETSAVLEAFGRFCVPALAARFPALLAPHPTPKALFLAINELHRSRCGSSTRTQRPLRSSTMIRHRTSS
jgi:hypothetical protein